jgi:hypothetical protein
VILAAVAAGLVVGTIVVIQLVIPYRRHLEIQRRLEVYRADPDSRNEVALVQVLAEGDASQEDVQEAVQSLVTLKVETWESYPPGGPIVVSIVPARKGLLDAITVMGLQETLRIPGHEGVEGKFLGPGNDAGLWYNLITSQPTHMVFPTTFKLSTGQYHANVTLGVDVALVPVKSLIISPPSPRPGLLDRCLIRLGLKSASTGSWPRTYHCTLELPVEIRVEDKPVPWPVME